MNSYLLSLQEPETEICSSMLDSLNECIQVSYVSEADIGVEYFL
jgi:hypothetical protein